MSAYRMRKNAWALPCALMAALLAMTAQAQDNKKQAQELSTQGQQQMSKGQPRDAMRRARRDR